MLTHAEVQAQVKVRPEGITPDCEADAAVKEDAWRRFRLRRRGAMNPQDDAYRRLGVLTLAV